MCKFCKENIILAEKNTSLGEIGKLTTQLELSTDGEEYFIGAYSCFSPIDSCVGDCIKINYCPVCGRKLTEVPTHD